MYLGISSPRKPLRPQGSLLAVISGKTEATIPIHSIPSELDGLDWRDWLTRLYPAYVRAPFARRHEELWDWFDCITLGVRPHPFVAIWPRGGAKSTTAELGVARIGARKTRNYVWYVSSTQDKADKHVESISALLESPKLAHYYPDLSSRKLGKYGNSKGWRRSRLRTASGLTVDALGLDVGARGAKVEENRPDMMIFDDVDEKTDGLPATLKKIDTITTSLLPAGSNDLATLFIQNVIHPESIAMRLVDGRADFMADRVISGPYPALEGLAYESREGQFFITAGVPTWQGQDITVCQDQIRTWGLSSFLQEAQHVVEQIGGIWDHIEFRHCERHQVPELVRACVWVDPAVTSTDKSDCMGIQADGIDEQDFIYRLYSWQDVTSPENAVQRAILKALEIGADHVGIETDQGGDTWQSVYLRVCERLEREAGTYGIIGRRFPAFVSDKAGAGYGSKVERNSRMLTDYEQGKVIHVIGTHSTLERSLKRFPIKPLDLADAAFWSWHDLRDGAMPMQSGSNPLAGYRG